MTAHDVLRRVINEQDGFITEEDIKVLAADDYIETTIMCLVRCSCGRFITRLGSVAHFVDIITREGTDYIRDVSLTVDSMDRIKQTI